MENNTPSVADPIVAAPAIEASTPPIITSAMLAADHPGHISGGKEVGYRGDKNDPVEPKVLNTINLSLQNAAAVAPKWDERVAKEGVVKWVSPFDHGRDKPEFDTPEACQEYMLKNHASQIEVAQLEKQPEQNYTPKRIVHDPPRRLTDFYPPEMAERIQTSQAAAASVTPIIEQINAKLNRTGASSLTKLIHGPTHVAMRELQHKGTDELQKIGREASNMGKVEIAREARRLIVSRGGQASWINGG